MAKALDPVDERIRKNLVRFREECGLSQAQLADLSGVPMNNLSRYERGENAVPASVIDLLSAVFGRKPGDFYENEPGPAPKPEERNVFFLRTWPGVEIDDKVAAEVREAIASANAKVRARKHRKG